MFFRPTIGDILKMLWWGLTAPPPVLAPARARNVCPTCGQEWRPNP